MLNSLLHIPKTNTNTNFNGSFATIVLNVFKENNINLLSIKNSGKFNYYLNVKYKNKITSVFVDMNMSATDILNKIKKAV